MKRRGSSDQGNSSASSAGSSSGQDQRPTTTGATSGSQDSTKASDSKQHPQQGSSKSATGSQEGSKNGAAATSKSATDSNQSQKQGTSQSTSEGQQRSTTGSSEQGTSSGTTAKTQQSGSAPAQGSSAQQSGTTGASSSTSSSASSEAPASNALANLSTEKRSEVTQAFTSTKANTVSNVNFDVSVGTTITDRVHLAPLPTEVVRLVPQYRGYEYVVVRDEIVIVQPKTKKIVEVIHKSGGSRKSASVHLSSEQRQKFKTTVETTGSTRSTASRIELREGEVLPADVSLLDVPQTIITEVPELRTYRYVVIGDEIGLVEPDTRRVIEIIK